MIGFTQLKRFDAPLFVLMVVLIVIGLAGLYSLSLAEKGAGSVNFSRQLIFASAGLVLFFFVCLIDFRLLRSLAYWVYFLGILLLILVLIAGETSRGMKGWLNFGFFNFQPTEFVKLAVIMFLASFWQRVPKPIRLKDAIKSVLFVSPSVCLIICQPDFGSAIVIVILWLSIFLLVNSNKKFIFGLAVIIVLVSVAAWLFFLKDYQRDRISTYLNPQADPLGRGYQITQSVVAVGSGRIFGRGFGLGSQSQLRFLPAAETDFIFVVFAEEFGLVGSLLLLGFYIFLLRHLIKIGLTVYDDFSLIMISGIAVYFFSQLAINVGMNLGLLPVIGLPLPLVSYGGSSLLISMLALAVVESVVLHQPFTKTL